MFGCTDPVQVLLHVVCHWEYDQLSILSLCRAVWPHLQSSCLLAACLRHVHADEQGPRHLFFCLHHRRLKYKYLFMLINYQMMYDMNNIPPMRPLGLLTAGQGYTDINHISCFKNSVWLFILTLIYSQFSYLRWRITYYSQLLQFKILYLPLNTQLGLYNILFSVYNPRVYIQC